MLQKKKKVITKKNAGYSILRGEVLTLANYSIKAAPKQQLAAEKGPGKVDKAKPLPVYYCFAGPFAKSGPKGTSK